MEREQIYRITNSGKIIPVGELVRCKDCMSLTSGEDPDCFVCNNPISPCYQREVSENDYCRHGKDSEKA